MGEGVARCQRRGMVHRLRPSPAGRVPACGANSIPPRIPFEEGRGVERAVGAFRRSPLLRRLSPHLNPGSA